MNKPKAPVFLVVLLLMGGGCASVPREAGFRDVQKQVAGREGHKIHWNRGTPEDEEVFRKVQELLKGELSAEAAVQVAILSNPSLQAIYEDLGVSQADLVQAGLLRNPALFSAAGFPNRSPSGVGLKFEFTLEFLNLLMIPARKRLAEERFEETKARVADRILRQAAETRRAYYEALGAQQTAQICGLIAEAAAASFDLARRMHAAGNLNDLGLARAQNQLEQVRVALAKNETAFRGKREKLNRLMGLWGAETTWRLPPRLPDLPAEEVSLEGLESIAVANRLDLAAARKELEIAARTLGISREWRWFLSAEVGAGGERDTDGQWVIGPSLSLELPLFDQHQARIARHEALLRKEVAKITALAIDIRSEVRELRDRLIYYRRLADHYRKTVIPLRERIVELTQREFNYMLVGAFDLITAKQQEYDAYLDYIEAVSGYWATRADLQRALGGRLPGQTGTQVSPSTPDPAGKEPAAVYRDSHPH